MKGKNNNNVLHNVAGVFCAIPEISKILFFSFLCRRIRMLSSTKFIFLSFDFSATIF